MILYETSRIESLSAKLRIFFILFFACADSFSAQVFLFIQIGDNMQLVLIKNPDDSQKVSYKLARIVFAETGGASLATVEAMASMIYNIHTKYDKSFEDIANDKNIFDVLNENSPRYELLNTLADDRKFQMCLRVVKTMMRGNLRDSVFGATKYHHADVIPDWAMARGYITECEDIIYYL